MKRICIVPGSLRTGYGGPPSFVRKLASGIAGRGVQIAYNFEDTPYEAVLVINATRNIRQLFRLKKSGVRIVQRLGIPNYLHKMCFTGVKAYVIAEARNFLMRYVRNRLADVVIYQSRFVEKRWDRRYGVAPVRTEIIHNAVDLEQFNPKGERYFSNKKCCFISVEGTQGADSENTAIDLAKGLVQKGVDVELLMFGKLTNQARDRLSGYSFVKLMGLVPNSDLPYFYRGASFYILTDVISACPNSVIEALACGTPVLGYNAGPLPELLRGKGGICADHANSAVGVEQAERSHQLVVAAQELIRNQAFWRDSARQLAEERYALGKMVDSYSKALRL